MQLLETRPGDPWFDGWCEAWNASGRAERPDDPPRPATDFLAIARQLLEPGGSRGGSHHAAVVDGQVAGALRLVLPLLDNTGLGIVELAVHPSWRRRGIGSALLALGLDQARAAGRTDVITEMDEPAPGAPGRAFAQKHGWTCDLEETRRDLRLPPDEQRLAAVEREAEQVGAAYDVVTWVDRVPDELLEDRALLERRMSTDAPHGDLPTEEEHWDGARIREYEQMHVARGRSVVSGGATKDGRLVAFTDLQVPLADPRVAHQGGTLVLREHRGNRLGARVKAAVLREVLRQHPGVQRVTTYNAEDNVPVVALNAALGFEPAGKLSCWSRRVEPLRRD